MGLAVKYLKAVIAQWFAIITGGILAVYLLVQPYAHFPSFTSRIFFSLFGLALAVASFRTWREERRALEGIRDELDNLKQTIQNEDPKVEITVHWPGDDVNSAPMSLSARNRGHMKLVNFRIQDLRLGHTIARFAAVPELHADVDTTIPVTLANFQAGADLLDALMNSYSDGVDPVDLSLKADVEKLNGQLRRLNYTLSYVPLSNPRRVKGAQDVDSCVTVRRS